MEAIPYPNHIFLHCLSICFGKAAQIRDSKAPWNYSHQFWSNMFNVLLLERPRPHSSMISGFLSPGEPLFIDLNIPKYFKDIRIIWKPFKTYSFCKSEHLEV